MDLRTRKNGRKPVLAATDGQSAGAESRACSADCTGNCTGARRAIAIKRALHPGKAARHPGLLAAGCGLSAGEFGSRCIAGRMRCPAELLRYYLEAWQGMFAPGSMQGTVQLFSMEYLALGLVVSLFLVLGLSALGPVMIFGNMMLYGLGSGLLMVQLCAAGGWKAILPALLWTGLPAAAASGCLCFFGACALQVSSRIHAYSFRKHPGGQARPGVQALLGQYLLTMVVLLPLCGAAAGLSYLGSRL